jgi:hypothetical protein
MPATHQTAAQRRHQVPVNAQTLAAELKYRGLVILDVAEQPGTPGVLIVYLHGNAGQWVDHYALRVIAAVPGVIGVTESARSPRILVVRIPDQHPDRDSVTDPKKGDQL